MASKRIPKKAKPSKATTKAARVPASVARSRPTLSEAIAAIEYLVPGFGVAWPPLHEARRRAKADRTDRNVAEATIAEALALSSWRRFFGKDDAVGDEAMCKAADALWEYAVQRGGPVVAQRPIVATKGQARRKRPAREAALHELLREASTVRSWISEEEEEIAADALIDCAVHHGLVPRPGNDTWPRWLATLTASLRDSRGKPAHMLAVETLTVCGIPRRQAHDWIKPLVV